MVDVDKAVVARLKKEGKWFEILVDCDNALLLKSGKNVPLNTILATDDIFSDVKKGKKAAEHDLQNIFATADPQEIAKRIITEGEVQLTQQHREKAHAELQKKIVYLVHRNAVDATTGLPHPLERLERAMREAKVNIRENENAEQQVERIIKELKPIIPIKMEKMEITLKIPTKYAGASMNLLKKYSLMKSEWQSDGSLTAKVEIPAGIQEEFFNEINKATHGNIESKIERKD